MNAGSTDTSLWTHYKAGEREYCGNVFPDGLGKNDRCHLLLPNSLKTRYWPHVLGLLPIGT